LSRSWWPHTVSRPHLPWSFITTFAVFQDADAESLTRRIVSGHTLVAFAFNTVIIALLFLGHS
jgi:uncharacterized membrane protein